MLDRALTERESEMVDFLQESVTRLVRGEVTGICLITVSPAGADSDWFSSSNADRGRLVGESTITLTAMSLEAAADETGG